MNPISMVVGNELGYFYEATIPDTVVFVPEHCISGDTGDVLIDDTKFYLSGWAVKSARFSGAAADCEVVFPDATKPVEDANDARLNALLRRLRHAYPLSQATTDFR